MSSFRRYKIGELIGEDLTVLDIIAEIPDRHPVYLVWDRRAWCAVACKIYRNDRGAHREHDVLARFSHPGIIRSLGTYEPAILLTEYLQGPTLSEYIEDQPSGRMSLSDAMRSIVHIGGALEYIHKQGFLHLDLKPSNVIIVNGRPILFDFGTARTVGQERPSIAQGTDEYMAPEECQLGTPSAKSDVFALGVTAFELLTGKLPFNPSRKVPYPQLTRKPTSMRRYRKDVPEALEALITRCLSLNPDERPALTELMCGVNNFIRRGAKMWPAGFDPVERNYALAA